MKAFIGFVVLVIIGAAAYMYFVDPDLLKDMQEAAKSKSKSNKFGMNDDCKIGSFKKIDKHLVDRLKLVKEEKDGKNGLTEYHYINKHGYAERKEFVRSVVLHVDDDKNIYKITAQTLYHFKKSIFSGAVYNFMNEYWQKLSGDEKPDWEGCVSMSDGGGDAYARVENDQVKAEYHWRTAGHPYREMKIDFIGNVDALANLSKSNSSRVEDDSSSSSENSTKGNITNSLKKKVLKHSVIIKGSHSTGSGFVSKLFGKPVVISNVHVFVGNKKVKFVTASGKKLDIKSVYFAKKYDLAFYTFKNPDKVKSYLELEGQFEKNVTNGSPVIVYGNSLGGGVVTELAGTVQGIGPEEIEVSAEFVQGNSGSPVIQTSTGKVIGVATYARKEHANWVTKGTRFSGVRRYALRVDHLTKKDLIKLDMKKYSLDLKAYHELLDKNQLGVKVIVDLVNNGTLSGGYKNLRMSKLAGDWNRHSRGKQVSALLADSRKLTEILTPSYFATGRMEFSSEAMENRIAHEKRFNRNLLKIYRGLTKDLKNLHIYKSYSGY